MAKTSNREKILTEGLRVVHERGFGGASVRDIVQAAGVPQGSFTNHFVSKEAFGLEILELYYAEGTQSFRGVLRDNARKPLERLGAYIDASKNRLNKNGMRNGCLFGNFSADANGSELIRERLVEMFAEIEDSISDCLHAAVEAGELPKGFDCETTAGFIVSSLQGANLLAKAQRSSAPLDRFKHLLFSKVLR